MSKSYSVISWVHESDPDWTDSQFHEHPGSFNTLYNAKVEAEKLAWLEFDRNWGKWDRPGEMSYLSKPVERKESNPHLQRPHRVRHRVKVDIRLSPKSLFYSGYEFEVVEFDV